MSASQSVIGYIPDKTVEELRQSGKLGAKDLIEIPLEAGKQESLLRVRHQDVEELRLGPSRDGHTSVQIVLKPGAQYEYTRTATADLQALRDPGLLFPFWPGVIVIYVRPRFTLTNNVFTEVKDAS